MSCKYTQFIRLAVIEKYFFNFFVLLLAFANIDVLFQ